MSENKYDGMTVNERLFVSGQLDAFDTAIKNKNVPEVIIILKKVELSDSSINEILKSYNLF